MSARSFCTAAVLAAAFSAFIATPAPALTNETPVRLSLRAFVTTALARHPALRVLEEGTKAERSLAQKALSVKELLLSVESGFTLTDPVFSGTGITAERDTKWTLATTLTRSFPELAGINAKVALGHTAASTLAVDGASSSVQSPTIGLTLTLPLLKNALGSADRATLALMEYTLKLLDRGADEARELLVQSLATRYYAWAIAVEKAAIYAGFFERAGQYLDQVVRRNNLGIADLADLMLARQNWLGYQSSWLVARQAADEQYIGIRSYLDGRTAAHTAAATNIVVRHVPDTALPPLAAIALRPAFFVATNTEPLAATNGAFENLRTLQIARLALACAEREAGIESALDRPGLDLVIAGEKSAHAAALDQALGTLNGNSFYAGLSFSLPLQNSAAEQTALAARHALAKKRHEYEATRIATSGTLRQNALAIATWRRIEGIGRDNTAAAAARVGALYTKYNQGRATLNNLTDAQDAWARARIAALDNLLTLRRLELDQAALTDRLTPDALPE